MPTYVFEKRDILNSHVRLDSESGPLVFTTATTRSLLRRNVTTLFSANQKHVASIRWKEKEFELQGKFKDTDMIKKMPESLFGRSDWKRFWQWDPAGPSPHYETRYGGHEWTVTELYTRSMHAQMTPHTSRIFGKSTHASITIPQGVSEIDKWFIFLILLRMETRRIDTDAAQASSASAAASSSAAAAAAVSC